MKIDIGDLYQHGDVILERVVKLPDGLKKAEHKPKVVLAEGEQHNHAHVFCDTDSTTMFIDDAGNKFIEVTSPSILTHEEHTGIEVDIGLYAIRQVMEYDHTKEESRAVLD